MNTSQSSLNPGASEFVPSFAMPNMSSLSLNEDQKRTNEPKYEANNRQRQPNNNYQQQQQNNYYGNNYQNHHNNHHNQHHHHNNRNNNYHHHNNQYQNQNNYYNNQHYNQHQQNYDVDPIELEARKEAVIEILQDDKIRDQLNTSSQNQHPETEPVPPPPPQENFYDNNNNNNNNNDPCDDEEMFEMMAMQEECRLEMMKFYIQSQNPTLFEQIYHDVSYPEAAGSKKVPEEELRSPKVINKNPETTENNETPNNTLRDLIINQLNPDVPEFVPNKFNNEPTPQAI